MKADGYMLIQQLDSSKKQEFDTIWCPHCSGHFRVMAGSGVRRGWCRSCGGPTCGKPQCLSGCAPFMRELEKSMARARSLESMGL